MNSSNKPVSKLLRQRPILAGPVKIIDGLPPTLHRFGPFKDNFIGRGSFGNVFSVRDPSDGVKYALKCIRIPNGVRASVVQEVNILMKLLEHDNIVKIRGAWPETILDYAKYMTFVGVGGSRGSSHLCSENGTTDNEEDFDSQENSLPPFIHLSHSERDVMFIKMEICDHSLEDYLNNQTTSEEICPKFHGIQVKQIFKQVLSVLEYLRELGVVHNDIRPANILLKGDIIKVADFGLAFLKRNNPIGENIEDFCTHPELMKEFRRLRSNPYKSPEVCLHGNNTFPRVSHKSDVFSVGAVIFRLLSSPKNKSDVWHLLDGDDKICELFEKLENRYQSESALLKIVKKMVSYSPRDRPEVDRSDLDLAAFLPPPSGRTTPKSQPLFSMVKGQLEIVTREAWGARPPKTDPDLQPYPAEMVIIAHSVFGEGYCSSDKSCELLMREIQDLHMDHNGWNDIAYQFVVGGNGRVYEGRGWHTIGAHTGNYNDNSVGICLMGDFRLHLSTKIQLEATKQLIRFGVEKGHIIPSYELYGHLDLRKGFDSPGEYLYQEICKWPNKAPTKFPFL